MPYYYSMRISRLMQTMLFRNFFNFLFPVLSSPSGFAAGLFIFFPSSFLFPVLLFSSLCPIYFSSLQIIKNTHVCEKKRPGSAASASEVFLRSLPFFYPSFLRFSALTLNFISYLCPINKKIAHDFKQNFTNMPSLHCIDCMQRRLEKTNKSSYGKMKSVPW